MFLLTEKGIITLDEIKNLVQDRIDSEERPAAHPAEISTDEVKRVFQSALRALETIEQREK
jgi:hypothetical protein